MKILHLHSENIKRIKAVDIRPENPTVIIGGKNANGKSSVLDSICMALAGEKMIPDRPIREGETGAMISVDLGKFKITRHWTGPDKSYLKMETEDGLKVSNAQTVLNALIGDLTFDPLEFSNMKPDARLKILKTITGVDLSFLDKEKDKVFAERTILHRDADQTKARLASEFSELPNFAAESIDLDKVKADKKRAELFNSEVLKNRADAKQALTQADTFKSFADENIAKIAELEAKIIQLKEVAEFNYKKAEEFYSKEAELSELGNVDLKNISSFDDKVEEFYKHQAAKEKAEQKIKLQEKLDTLRAEWQSKTDRLKEIEKEKLDTVAAAKMPIEGLAFGEGDVTFGTVPFAQLSTAEQIKVSMSIAIAMNPKIRIALIHNGSLLDSDSMEQVSQMALENDMQIWIERVSDSPDAGSIYIEDGTIKEI